MNALTNNKTFNVIIQFNRKTNDTNKIYVILSQIVLFILFSIINFIE